MAKNNNNEFLIDIKPNIKDFKDDIRKELKSVLAEAEHVGKKMEEGFTPDTSEFEHRLNNLEKAVETLTKNCSSVKEQVSSMQTGFADFVRIQKEMNGQTQQMLDLFNKMTPKTKELFDAFITRNPADAMKVLEKAAQGVGTGASGAASGFDDMQKKARQAAEEAAESMHEIETGLEGTLNKTRRTADLVGSSTKQMAQDAKDAVKSFKDLNKLRSTYNSNIDYKGAKGQEKLRSDIEEKIQLASVLQNTLNELFDDDAYGTPEYGQALIDATKNGYELLALFDKLDDKISKSSIFKKDQESFFSNLKGDIKGWAQEYNENIDTYETQIGNIKLKPIKLHVNVSSVDEIKATINKRVEQLKGEIKPVKITLDFEDPNPKKFEQKRKQLEKEQNNGEPITDEQVQNALNDELYEKSLGSMKKKAEHVTRAFKDAYKDLSTEIQQFKRDVADALRLQFTWNKSDDNAELNGLLQFIQDTADMTPIDLTPNTQKFIDDIQNALNDHKFNLELDGDANIKGMLNLTAGNVSRDPAQQPQKLKVIKDALLVTTNRSSADINKQDDSNKSNNTNSTPPTPPPGSKIHNEPKEQINNNGTNGTVPQQVPQNPLTQTEQLEDETVVNNSSAVNKNTQVIQSVVDLFKEWISRQYKSQYGANRIAALGSVDMDFRGLNDEQLYSFVENLLLKNGDLGDRLYRAKTSGARDASAIFNDNFISQIIEAQKKLGVQITTSQMEDDRILSRKYFEQADALARMGDVLNKARPNIDRQFIPYAGNYKNVMSVFSNKENAWITDWRQNILKTAEKELHQAIANDAAYPKKIQQAETKLAQASENVTKLLKKEVEAREAYDLYKDTTYNKAKEEFDTAKEYGNGYVAPEVRERFESVQTKERELFATWEDAKSNLTGAQEGARKAEILINELKIQAERAKGAFLTADQKVKELKNLPAESTVWEEASNASELMLHEMQRLTEKYATEFPDNVHNIVEYLTKLNNDIGVESAKANNESLSSSIREKASQNVEATTLKRNAIIEELRPYAENFENARKAIVGDIATLLGGYKFEVVFKDYKGKKHLYSFGNAVEGAEKEAGQSWPKWVEMLNEIDKNEIVSVRAFSTPNNAALRVPYDDATSRSSAMNTIMEAYNNLDDKTKAYVDGFISSMELFVDDSAGALKKWRMIQESFFTYNDKNQLITKPELNSKYKSAREKEDDKTPYGEFLRALETGKHAFNSRQSMRASDQRRALRDTDKPVAVTSKPQAVSAWEREYKKNDEDYRTVPKTKKTLEEHNADLAENSRLLEEAREEQENYNESLAKRRERHQQVYNQQLTVHEDALGFKELRKLYPDIKSYDDFTKAEESARNALNNSQQLKSDAQYQYDINKQYYSNLESARNTYQNVIDVAEANIAKATEAGGPQQYLDMLNKQINDLEEAGKSIGEANKQNTEDLKTAKKYIEAGIDVEHWTKEQQELEEQSALNNKRLEEIREQHLSLVTERTSFGNTVGLTKTLEEYVNKQKQDIVQAEQQKNKISIDQLATAKTKMDSSKIELDVISSDVTRKEEELNNLRIAFAEHYYDYLVKQYNNLNKAEETYNNLERLGRITEDDKQRRDIVRNQKRLVADEMSDFKEIAHPDFKTGYEVSEEQEKRERQSLKEKIQNLETKQNVIQHNIDNFSDEERQAPYKSWTPEKTKTAIKADVETSNYNIDIAEERVREATEIRDAVKREIDRIEGALKRGGVSRDLIVARQKNKQRVEAWLNENSQQYKAYDEKLTEQYAKGDLTYDKKRTELSKFVQNFMDNDTTGEFKFDQQKYLASLREQIKYHNERISATIKEKQEFEEKKKTALAILGITEQELGIHREVTDEIRNQDNVWRSPTRARKQSQPATDTAVKQQATTPQPKTSTTTSIENIDNSIDSEDNAIDESKLKLFDARIQANDREISELRANINGLTPSEQKQTINNEPNKHFKSHYLKMGENLIDADVDKANSDFYKSLKQGSANKKGRIWADFSDSNNINAIITKARELRSELVKMYKEGKEGSKEYITLQRQLSKLLEVTRKNVSKTNLADGYDKKKSDGTMTQKSWVKFLTDRGATDLSKFVDSKTNIGTDEKFKNTLLEQLIGEKLSKLSIQYQEGALNAYNSAFNAQKERDSKSDKTTGHIMNRARNAGQKAFEQYIAKVSDNFSKGTEDIDVDSILDNLPENEQEKIAMEAGAATEAYKETLIAAGKTESEIKQLTSEYFNKTAKEIAINKYGNGTNIEEIKSNLNTKVQQLEEENRLLSKIRQDYIDGVLSEEYTNELFDLLPTETQESLSRQAWNEAKSKIDTTGKTEEQIKTETAEIANDIMSKLILSAINGTRTGIHNAKESYNDTSIDSIYEQSNENVYLGSAIDEFVIQANNVIVNGSSVSASNDSSGPWALNTNLDNTNEILRAIRDKVNKIDVISQPQPPQEKKEKKEEEPKLTGALKSELVKLTEQMVTENAIKGKDTQVSIKKDGTAWVKTVEKMGNLTEQTLDIVSKTASGKFESKVAARSTTISGTTQAYLSNVNKQISNSNYVDKESSTFTSYQQAYKDLLAMTNDYSQRMDSLHEHEKVAWNNQIDLVKNLGSALMTNIKKAQKFNVDSVIETSNTKLQRQIEVIKNSGLYDEQFEKDADHLFGTIDAIGSEEGLENFNTEFEIFVQNFNETKRLKKDFKALIDLFKEAEGIRLQMFGMDTKSAEYKDLNKSYKAKMKQYNDDLAIFNANSMATHFDVDTATHNVTASLLSDSKNKVSKTLDKFIADIEKKGFYSGKLKADLDKLKVDLSKVNDEQGMETFLSAMNKVESKYQKILELQKDLNALAQQQKDIIEKTYQIKENDLIGDDANVQKTQLDAEQADFDANKKALFNYKNNPYFSLLNANQVLADAEKEANDSVAQKKFKDKVAIVEKYENAIKALDKTIEEYKKSLVADNITPDNVDSYNKIVEARNKLHADLKNIANDKDNVIITDGQIDGLDKQVNEIKEYFTELDKLEEEYKELVSVFKEKIKIKIQMNGTDVNSSEYATLRDKHNALNTDYNNRVNGFIGKRFSGQFLSQFDADKITSDAVLDERLAQSKSLDSWIAKLKKSALWSDELETATTKLRVSLANVNDSASLSDYIKQLGVVENNYQELIKLQEDLNELINLRKQIGAIDSDLASPSIIPERKNVLKQQQNVLKQQFADKYNAFLSSNNPFKESLDYANKLNDVATEIQNKISGQKYKKKNDFINKYVDQLAKMEHAYAQIDASMSTSNPTDAMRSQMSSAYNALQDLKGKLVDIANSDIDLISPEDKANLESIVDGFKKYTKSIQTAIDASEKLKASGQFVDVFDDAQINNLNGSMSSLARSLYGANVVEKNFNNITKELTFTVQTGKNELKTFVYKFDELSKAVYKTGEVTQQTDGFLKSMFTGIKSKITELARYYTGMSILTEAIQQVRIGVQYVREIDIALTELKKVTDESNESYQKFLQSMSKTASVVGSTVKDLTSSAADWARIGYSMQDAGELAATTAKLLNVSEFDSVEDATSALVSTLQAFSEDGKDAGQRAEEIVDILNNIGNQYPVATNELASGLADSGAALVAANNSIEEQVSLLAAGNATMQDISSVAAGLKIVAARLRGTTSDIDDDADSAITNVSKLQAKIKALTADANGGEGIDIINEDGSYKSTYEILKEISGIFDKMDDMSAASLLELIAGKNRSSIVAAILQNGEILEDAYTDALDSAGSSAKELDTYLNSIQGRIDLFTNALQTMWYDALDSDFLKVVIDAGTLLIKTLDAIINKIGVVGTVISGTLLKGVSDALMKKNGITDIFGLFSFAGNKMLNASGMKPVIDAFKNSFQILSNTFGANINSQVASMVANNITDYTRYADVIKSLNAAKQAEILINNGVAESEQLAILSRNLGSDAAAKLAIQEANLANAHGVVEASMMGELVSTGALTTEQAAATVSTLGLVSAEGEAVVVSKADALAKIEAAVAAGTLSAADAEAIISVLGLTGATASGAVGFQAFTASIWGAIKALWTFLTTTPVGWFMLAAGAIAATVAVIDGLTTSHKEYVEQIEESTRDLEEIQNKIKSLNDELATTKSRIDELENKKVPSFAEQEELNRLKEYNSELDRQIKLEEAREKRKKQSQIASALGAYKSDANFKDKYAQKEDGSYGAAASGASRSSLTANQWDKDLQTLESAKAKYDEAKNKLFEAQENGIDTNSAEFKQLEQDVKNTEDAYVKANNTVDALATSWETAYGNVGYIENATTDDEKAWNDIYRQYQDYINKQAFINGDITKAHVLANEFGSYATDIAKEFKTKFEDGIKEGKTAEDIINEFASNEDYKSIFDKLFEYDISNNDIIGFFTNTGEYAEKAVEQVQVAVTSLDALTSAIDSYKNVLDIVNSITTNGQAISEDYYNTLKEQLADVTFAEQDFSHAIEEQNGKYIVKNIALLGQLVTQSRNVQKANINTAKSQAQLQYKELAQKIRSTIVYLGAEAQANEFVSQAIADNINVMRDQMEAIEQTMQEYALLELSLTDAANAFDEFEKAKERDAKMTYDDSMLEMLKTIDEGLLKNETGTEAFEYAVKAIVPEQFWKDIDDVDEKVKSIHDYLDGDNVFSRFFYVDEESGELDITADNVREFVDLCLDATNQIEGATFNPFVGDNTDFSLSDDVKSVKDFADQLGVTEAVALAMLTALEKVDAKWGHILTDVTLTPFERNINTTVEDIATLNEQFADGTIDIETYATKMAEAEVELAKLKNEARQAIFGSDNGTEDTSDDTYGIVELNKQVLDSTEKVNKAQQDLVDAQKKYDDAVKNGKSDKIIDALANRLDKAKGTYQDSLATLNEVIAKRDELSGEYGEYTIRCVLEDVDAEIEAFGDKFNETLITEAGFEKDANGYWVSINPELDLSDLKAKDPELVSYIEKLNQKTTLEALLDPTKAEEAANALQTTVNNIITAIETNLITLDLDDGAVKNIVEQANKILDGITQHLGVKISATLPSWLKNILKFMGFDVDSGDTTTIEPETTSSGTTKYRGYTRALGNAYANGNVGLKSNEHNSVVGELGRELVCDVDKGVYYTVGDNGTEMVNLPKNAIIYNHKQTEELLKTGHTSRGKFTGGTAFAKGNAHGSYGIPTYHPNLEDPTSFANYTRVNTDWMNATSALLDAADSLSDAADALDDTINWIDVLFTRIENNISEQEAYLETITDNITSNSLKDTIYESIYGHLYSRANSSLSARDYYRALAEQEMSGLDSDTVRKIRNGEIEIQKFVGTGDEETDKVLEKQIDRINKAIGYYDKVSEYEQQYWTTITEIADKAVAQQEDIANAYQNEIGLVEHVNNSLEARNDLLATQEGFASKAYYEAQIDANEIILSQLNSQRDAMQDSLDEAVRLGRVKVGSQQWFDMQQAIYDVDDAIIDTTASIEDLQNSINDLHWERFDELINRFGYLEEEISNVIQLLSHDPDGLVMEELRDLTSDDWATGSGLTTIGLYAQEMERAKYVADEYAKAIDQLEQDYASGKYNETEYLSKLNELISAQYENIEKYHDAKNAIIELNEARVDAIRDGIEKEIDAYNELIDKKKESLSAEQDLHDFQNDVAEKEKEVADIKKQLAAMDGDNTAATTAKKKQLQAQLVEAQKALEETYYSHSMTTRQEALDKEFSDFEEEKNAEIEKWEEWLKDTENVVSEALSYVKANTELVYSELDELGSTYSLTLSENLTSPWTVGQTAIDNYSVVFADSTSAFTEQLQGIVDAWNDVTSAAEEAARIQAKALQQEYNSTITPTISGNGNGGYSGNNNGNGSNGSSGGSNGGSTPAKPTSQTSTPSLANGSSVTVKTTATNFSRDGGNGTKMQSFVPGGTYTVYQVSGNEVLIGRNGAYTGWVYKKDLVGFKDGGIVKKDDIYRVEELGEELQIMADGQGRLSYMRTGSGVLTAPLTERLMNLALDPTSVLEDMMPKTKVPSINANNTNFEMNIDKVVNIEHADSTSIPEIKRAINAQMESYMHKINQGLRRSGAKI